MCTVSGSGVVLSNSVVSSVAGKSAATTAATTVMIANQPTLQQGQVGTRVDLGGTGWFRVVQGGSGGTRVDQVDQGRSGGPG